MRRPPNGRDDSPGGDGRPPFDQRHDAAWIAASGVVVRLIPDARDDRARHQRFVVRVRGGQTVLVAHNTELAGRVPLSLGDRVRLRGLYEWNDLGGLVHWTHRDPMGGDGGFLEHRRKRYC